MVSRIFADCNCSLGGSDLHQLRLAGTVPDSWRGGAVECRALSVGLDGISGLGLTGLQWWYWACLSSGRSDCSLR